MSGKKLLAKTNRSLESPPPPTATSSLFLGGKDDLQTEQHVAGEFLASNFLDKNKSRQQREFVFGSSISPPEKARIFSYKKMYSNISLLSTWVALAGNRHKTPRDSSLTGSGICFLFRPKNTFPALKKNSPFTLSHHCARPL